MKNKLSIIELDEIISLFELKGWKIDDGNNKSLYKRFLKKYQSFNTDSNRKIFLDLARNYEYIPIQNYIEILKGILESVFIDDAREDILVMPLLSKKDIRRIKSGAVLSYLFQSVELKFIDRLSKKKFTVIDDYEHLGSKIVKNGKRLFLVDDYVGSGEQAIRAIKDVIETINQVTSMDKINQIAIISLYSNKKGIESINQFIKNFEIIEYYYGEETNGKAHNYRAEIESQLDPKAEDFGYKDCGDLITLIRTPNNTLNLFRMRDGPFQRF